MNDGKIHIPAKRREYTNQQSCIKITPEAYNLLLDVVEESDGLSLRQAASLIIVQAIQKDLIRYDVRRDIHG